MFKMRFVFEKRGMMKYISHLDLMRLLTRALRRGDIPVRITQGFNPHPKLSMSRALKLGVESGHEEAAIALASYVKPEDFIVRLQAQLPEGIFIKQAGIA